MTPMLATWPWKPRGSVVTGRAPSGAGPDRLLVVQPGRDRLEDRRQGVDLGGVEVVEDVAPDAREVVGRDAAEQRTRLQVSEERVRLLEQAVRRTTQRVNLFERILIPRSREAIKRIMIYLGDLERSSVANSKLTKAKLKKQQEALHGGRS